MRASFETRIPSAGVFDLAAPTVLIAAMLAGAATGAHAQAANAPPAAGRSEASSVEEVVVTARKRAERLRDIPTAGTALSAESIREIGGVPTAQALLTNTPGVNFANTANPVTSEVSIRGSGTSRATTAESGVGLFRDGAFIGGGTVAGRTFTDLDLFDVERIEVLRGTQGGLNGRNAEGGSVNVVSARPTHIFEGYAQGDIGNNDHADGQLVVNLPLDDHWALRLGAEVMRQSKGFYYLPLRDEYADQQFKNFYRGQLNYTAGPFTANLLAEHAGEQLPGLVYQVVTFPSATYPSGWAQDRFNLPWNSPSAAKVRMDNYEFTTNTNLPFGALSTTTMYRDRWGQNAYDRDAESIEFVRQLVAQGKVAPASVPTVLAGDYALGGNQTDHARILYQDVHVAGDKVGGFTWVAGAEYYLLNDKPQSVLSKTPTAASPSPGTVDVGRETFESYAVYGSASYDLTSRLNLAADMRVTHDSEGFVSQRLDFASGLPAANSAAFSIAGTTDDTNFSYTVSLTYKPTTDWLIYGKIGSGYRPGGFNTSLGDSRQPIPVPKSYDPETLTSYEIGFKGNLAPNLYVTAAVYDNEFDNLIIQGNNGCFVGSPTCPVQQTVFAFNAASASLWGVEVEATARFDVLGGDLRVSAGGSRQGGELGGVDKGLRQPQQPDWTMTFNVNYRKELADGVAGFFNIKGNGRWGGVQEVAQIPPMDDYVSVDGRAGVDWGRYELALYAQNLFDETYYVFAAPTAINNVIRYNFPRTYGVQLRYTW